MLNSFRHLVKPFSFHNLMTSGCAFSPAFKDLQLFVTGEMVAWEKSDIPFSGAIEISSMLTGEEIWSCQNR